MSQLVLALVSDDGEMREEWGLLHIQTDEEKHIVRESHITKLVTAALWKKQIAGAKEHGHVMNAFDGKVNALAEAFQEALDLTQYLAKARMERNEIL